MDKVTKIEFSRAEVMEIVYALLSRRSQLEVESWRDFRNFDDNNASIAIIDELLDHKIRPLIDATVSIDSTVL